MPGFLDILPRVAEFHHAHKQEIAAHNTDMVVAFEQAEPTPHAESISDSAALDNAARDLARSFDPVWGGFGKAPKFPRPTELEFALRYAAADAGLLSPEEYQLIAPHHGLDLPAL
jgi:uncharacterized protein YyaL (SSP411 family)